ncbi:MAG: ComEA family DNA-binding protein [Jaaginema sp. PMC 1079.18]|nr:ComEA family DNA-binding protein [Jaaginema sp. PMC 1080.18]MEC4852113.1 ComEA family DNA-binding protein [Jaaginema sp. PMC 1079.18]MEC4866526.1 ComEA family DNA-binding protein [Jaaginema sp. PMC 1078.18]
MSWLSRDRGWQQLNLKRQGIRARLARDPYYRLQSRDEVEVAAELGLSLDVNRATVDDWLRLPGLSIHQARSLVELTHAGVQFLCVEDVAAAIGVSLQAIQFLAPILAFNYYDPESTLHPRKVSLNTANLGQLQQIPGVDDSLCERIIRDRAQQGSYRNLAHFQQRLNLDSELIGRLMYYLQW